MPLVPREQRADPLGERSSDRGGFPLEPAQLTRGEFPDPSTYYLRTAPFFETADARYGWLNHLVAVGMGERVPDGVLYQVFEIL